MLSAVSGIQESVGPLDPEPENGHEFLDKTFDKIKTVCYSKSADFVTFFSSLQNLIDRYKLFSKGDLK